MALQKTETQMLVVMRVKKLRVNRNISQQQLAQILGATNGHIGNIESWKYASKYTLNQLNTIAHYFAVPVESFFKSDEDGELTISEYTDRVCKYMEG